MDEPSIDNPHELDQLLKDDASLARSVSKTSPVVATEAGAAEEVANSKKTVGTKLVETGKAALTASSATALAEEVGISAAGVQQRLQEDPEATGTDILEEVFRQSERFDDPKWNPRENAHQKAEIMREIDRAGVDIDSPEASSLLGAGSSTDLHIIAEQVQQEQDRMKTIQDSGAVGTALFLTAGIADLDTLTGVGLFHKMRKAKQLQRVNELTKSGKLDAATVASLTTRTDNIKAGVEAGAVAGGVTEGTRALVDPSYDEKDALGGVILGAALGTGIGAVLPAANARRVTEDIVENRILSAAIKSKKAAQATGQPKRAQRSGKVEVDSAITNAAKKLGVDEDYLFNQARLESSFRTKVSPDTSSAQGLFQFIDGTWMDMLNKHGRKHGVNMDLPRKELLALRNNADLSSIMAAEFAKGNAKHLKKSLGKDQLTSTDMYMAHFMGAGGATSFLTKMKNSPSDIAAEAFPKQAKANEHVFYNIKKDANGKVVEKTPRTLRQVYAYNDKRLNGHLKDSVKNDSVGAARVEGAEAPEVRTSNTSQTLREQANDFVDENDDILRARDFLEDSRTGESFIQDALQRGADLFHKGLQKTPFRTDYDNLSTTSGSVGMKLSYELYDSPTGHLVNNRSASGKADLLERDVTIEYAPRAPGHYKAWAQDKGIKRVSRQYHFGGQHEFGREIQSYMAHVEAGLTPPKVHSSVKAAAEDLDRSYKKLLDNNKKHGVDGFEDVQHTKGFFNRRWTGRKVRDVETKVGTDVLLESLQNGIIRKNKDIDPIKAQVYAMAIRRAARDQGTNNAVGSLMTVNSQGKSSLEEAIQELGLDTQLGKSSSDIADSILYKSTDKGIVKEAKERIDIDMTTQIGNTEFTLLDLIDNDIYGTMDRTARGQSNHAALASVGIQHRDKDNWIQAARDEADDLGLDADRAGKAVDDAFGYYGESAFGAGDVNAGRLNKLAILSFLPQLGITQIAEAGVAMGVVGIDAWTKAAKKSLSDMIHPENAEVMENLMGVKEWRGDHNHFVITDHLDEINAADSHKLMKLVDRAMDKGLKGLGYISGFYKVNEFLHRTAALSMSNMMTRAVRDGLDTPRLRSMGLDDEYRSILQDKIDKGIIEFGPDGHLADMGSHKWDSDDELDILRVVTRRNMDATVQKGRKGESSAWMYTALGAPFASLKSFSLIAAQKQLIKNARLADPEAFMMLLTTTGTSALAVGASAVVNGNGDKLGDTEYIAKRALNWSPLLAPGLMAVDPLSFMLGMDKIPGSPFPLNSWRYGHSGLISLPAGVSALSNLAGLGRVPVDVLDGGGLDSTSINAIKALPIVGRSYPMIPIIESLK